MKFKNALILGLFTLGLAVLPEVHAANCFPNTEINRFSFDYTFDSQINTPGYATDWREYNLNRLYQIGGPCNGRTQATFFTFQAGPGLISAGSSNGAQWFDVPDNDYLQIAMQIYVGGNVGRFVDIPQVGFSNGCSGNCSSTGFTTGSRVNARVKVKRRFVGKSFIINREVGYLYAATTAADRPTQTIAIINLSARITVPQSCTFDVGQIIEFNFGEIPTTAFSSAGAGNAALGVPIQSKNLGIECNNIAAQQMLTARLEVTNPNQNIIVSNNSDVGFRLADKDNNVLIPNNINSRIPFRLDNNARSSFILNSWPVSITGNRPAPGPVSAEGHIRIDFD